MGNSSRDEEGVVSHNQPSVTEGGDNDGASRRTHRGGHRGGSGIGQAIALGYAREGAQVVVLDINADAAAETAKAITGAGGKACSFKLDVTERDKCREVAARDRQARSARSRSW